MSVESKAKVEKYADYDSESGRVGEAGEPPLQRSLKARHMAMISIGGVIGTGLFLGTGNALANGGPLGLFLGYAIMGSITYSVMISLGEMVSFLPIPGGHIKLAERFVDPAMSFAMGWNYWYNWTMIMPAELSASAILVGFWDKHTSAGVYITVTLIVAVGINLLGAGAYGEAEFIFASIKVLTITGLIILGIVLDLGGGPNHDRIGFRYWKNPGPFTQYDNISGAKGRFLGWLAVLTQAAFSYIGTEIVAIAAGEAKNPRRNLPRAIKRVYVRILIFYLGGTFIIGLLVPSNSESLKLGHGTATASPFVIAIRTAGIKALPSIINAALLTSAWSAASSDLYTSSRAIYGLALSGNAPKVFMKTTRKGMPYVAVTFCALFASFAYLSLGSGSGTVFVWFQNMTSIAGLLTWFGISITYIRFYAGTKAQGINRLEFPFASRLQPYAAYYSAFMTLLICIISGWAVFLRDSWDTATFITNYIPLALFPLLYFSYRFIKRIRSHSASDMDFITGLDAIEAETYDEEPPKNKVQAFWSWLM